MESEEGVGALAAGTDSARGDGLRSRLEVFARLRSAHRALPAAAMLIDAWDAREDEAHELRVALEHLSEAEGTSEPAEDAFEDIDRRLVAMEVALLDHFDGLGFASLRAAIPRAIASHRHEVISLLEVALDDQQGLARRLPEVEYLITMLSTEELDGQRSIVRDPVSLTQRLSTFEVEGLSAEAAEAVAIDLYQVASLDTDGDDPSQVLMETRARKEAIGIGCLHPTILRAVVTYNARMFNWVESAATAARESDAFLQDLLPGSAEREENIWVESSSDLESLEERLREPSSVFDGGALDAVMESLRQRLLGGEAGGDAAGRLALVIDLSRLDAIEREALLSEARSDQERLLALTAVVGLLIRDLGAVQSGLEELGLSEPDLKVAWASELNDRLARRIADLVASGEDYELATILSGLKTKHLLVPMSEIRAKRRGQGTYDVIGEDDAAAEMRRVSQEALEDTESKRFLRRGYAGYSDRRGEWGFWPKEGKRLAYTTAAMPLVLLLGLLTANSVVSERTTVGTLEYDDLADVSVFIASAYRSDQGNGKLLVGQVHPGFLRLSLDGKIEQAEEMRTRLTDLGIEQAMVYDRTGLLHVHIANDFIRRPRKKQSREVQASIDSLSEESRKPFESGYAWRSGGAPKDGDGESTMENGAEGDAR